MIVDTFFVYCFILVSYIFWYLIIIYALRVLYYVKFVLYMLKIAPYRSQSSRFRWPTDQKKKKVAATQPIKTWHRNALDADRLSLSRMAVRSLNDHSSRHQVYRQKPLANFNLEAFTIWTLNGIKTLWNVVGHKKWRATRPWFNSFRSGSS